MKKGTAEEKDGLYLPSIRESVQAARHTQVLAAESFVAHIVDISQQAPEVQSIIPARR